jgi:uncharacterized membrane protein YfcA
MLFSRIKKSKYFQSPYLEIIIMISSIILAFFGLYVLSLVPGIPEEGAMPTSSVSFIILAFFLLSVAIALISVIAGIGGGVIFTPLMLAFTSVNSLVVRGTGLIVAMFSGIISTGIFIKKGLGNYKLCMLLTLSQSGGALLGAALAVTTSKNAGAMGEGLMRTALGILLALIAVYLFFGGKKLEWPVIKKIGRFTSALKLGGSYFEEAEGQVRKYEVTRAPLGILLLFFVGMLGGFFGMGGGWAITPALNLGMGLPLKLAAANSGVILGIGSCVSIWPYINAGSIIPLFVLPWLSGQVIGGFIGSYALARIRAKMVRWILIGIMIFTAFGLVTKGLNVLGIMGNVPPIIQVIVFIVIFAGVIATVLMSSKTEKNQGKKEKKADISQQTKIPKLSIPKSHMLYANIIHWVTIIVSIAALFIPVFVLVNPSNNVLNPNIIFGEIFKGATPEGAWALAENGVFPGTHFYLDYITKTDSWAMLNVNIGCMVGLLAVVPAVLVQIFKEKNILEACLGTAMAALIISAMAGIL